MSKLGRHQPGDPKKAVRLMIDLVKGETVPLRLPIGRDTREAVKTTCKEMLKAMEEWKDVIDSTDFSEN
jgi:hypothetical protein